MDRLPRGRHGLSPEFVAQNQRERLIAGLTEVLYEVGYQKTTVSLIGQRAAVSKSDFYKHFESKDDCFIAAYDAAIERIREQVLDACGSTRDDGLGGAGAGRHRLTAGPARRASRRWPAWSWSRGCAPAAASTTATRRRWRASSRYCARGRPGARTASAVPEATDEAVVGGIASLLGRRVARRRGGAARRAAPRRARVRPDALPGRRRGEANNLCWMSEPTAGASGASSPRRS